MIVPSLVKLPNFFYRRRFRNFVNVFRLFCNYLPLRKGVAVRINKLEVWLDLKIGWNRRSGSEDKGFFDVVTSIAAAIF